MDIQLMMCHKGGKLKDMAKTLHQQQDFPSILY